MKSIRVSCALFGALLVGAANVTAFAATGVPTILNTYEEMQAFAPNGLLRWSEVPGADAYEVWVYGFSPGSGYAFVESSAPLASREYRFTKLSGGTTYHATLYSRTGGTWVPSPTFPIRTTSSVLKPRLSNPQEELESFADGGVLRWDAVAGATSYEVWIYGDAGLGTLIENSGPTRGTQYQPRNLPGGRTYHVQIYSLVDGVFRAGAALPVRRPVESATRARLLNPQEELDAFAPGGVLRWSGAPLATAYEVWIYDNPNASEVTESSGPLGLARSYAPRALQPDRTYYARVYALLNGERWDAGAPLRIRTVARPSVARLTNPQNELDAFAPRGTLTWTPVPGADRYEVWVFGNRELSVVAEAGVGAGTSYTVSRLCAPATYHVQVYSRVAGKWSVGSATSVRLEGAGPAGCVPPAPLVRLEADPAEVESGGTVTLRWHSEAATTCLGSGTWSGPRPTSGELVLGPSMNRYPFTLECSGPSGTTTARALVTIAIPDFDVTALGTVQGYVGSQAMALSDNGQVVGLVREVMAGTRPARPFLYSAGRMSLVLPPRTGGVAYGVNDVGEVVGQSGAAFVAREGTILNLGTLGGTTSAAMAINANGNVAGYSATVDPGVTRAFAYEGAGLRDLGTLGGASSWAYGIDRYGRIVGAAETAQGQRHAFFVQDGGMTDLGTLKGGNSTAYAIGASGAIVGSSDDLAVLYQLGRIIDLGTLGGARSVAYAINAGGLVVGAAESSAWSWNAASAASFGPDERAFLYTAGAMYDLNEHLAQPFDSVLTEARGVNESGQIVANACRSEITSAGISYTDCRAVLLSPVREIAPAQ